MRLLLVAPLGLLLSGCLARTAVDIVTLPVRVVGAGVDAVTTSQSEADERRGRQVRQEEERLGRAARRDRDRGRTEREAQEEADDETPKRLTSALR